MKVAVVVFPGSNCDHDALHVCDKVLGWDTNGQCDCALPTGLTLGICNGFQVLIEAGLLPGALLNNDSLQFRCVWTHLKVQTIDCPFTAKLEVGDVLKVPIAHGEGNYFAPPELLQQLQDERRIAFRYCDERGRITPEANPNGSVDNIAGILSEGRNVLGMMPHPERASELLLGSADGKRIFDSLGNAYAEIGW